MKYLAAHLVKSSCRGRRANTATVGGLKGKDDHSSPEGYGAAAARRPRCLPFQALGFERLLRIDLLGRSFTTRAALTARTTSSVRPISMATNSAVSPSRSASRRRCSEPSAAKALRTTSTPTPSAPATFPAVVRPLELSFRVAFCATLGLRLTGCCIWGARRLADSRRRRASSSTLGSTAAAGVGAGRGFGRGFSGAVVPFAWPCRGRASAWAPRCRGGALPCGGALPGPGCRRAAPSAGGRRGAGALAWRGARSRRAVRRVVAAAAAPRSRRRRGRGRAGRRHGTWAAAAAAAL